MRGRRGPKEGARSMSCSEWVIVAVAVLTITLSTTSSESPSLTSLPGCPESCGGISIHYPFGVGDNCSYNKIFSITCNRTFNHPIPRPIYHQNLEVLGIDLVQGQIRFSNNVSRACYKGLQSDYTNWTSVASFTLNPTQNMFAATGCDTVGVLAGTRSLNRTSAYGCVTVCNSPSEVDNGTCAGAGCCKTTIPEGINSIEMTVSSVWNYKNTSKELTPCGSAFVVATDSFNFTLANLTTSPEEMPVSFPVVFDWTIGNQTCEVARANGDCLCCNQRGSECIDSKLGGYLCNCSLGYSGNPYLPNGCKDIDECKTGNVSPCEQRATCVNSEGSYQCQCPKGFQGNGTTLHPCVPIQKIKQTAFKIIIMGTVGGSIIFLLVLGFLLHWHYVNRQLTKMRSTFFRQNGGLILHQRLSKRDAPVDVIEIFTAEELKKATNNYSQNNIIGRGGFGVVYKGKLPNNQAVAIKKSLKVDSSQIEQFINEVLVLSQVNNRNVVKLLGCCLETEVPVLVYEFIRNGTLHDHLHGDQRKASLLSWDIRLRIATEVAQVLAYLHTTISTPIIHRDIKSMNILLDENYVAKVSDFGTSRLVPMDKQQVATMVQGTHGYLDPEYMQTGELNEKSDVYSFGVVLLELLTGRKALSFVVPQNERVLANHFLLKFNDKEQSILDIVDEKIKDSEATEQLIEQLTRTAILARRCVQLKGEDRPDMKEVAMELEDLMRGKY